MNIQLKENITKNDQDGLGLVYDIDGREIEVQISGTAQGMWNITAENAGDLLKHLIGSVVSFIKDQGASVDKIDIFSDGASVKGKIIYSKDECENFFKNNN